MSMILKTTATAALLALGIGSMASAATYNEIGDASDVMGGAQDVGVGTDAISGSLDDGDLDKDWYQLSYGMDVQFEASNLTPFSLGFAAIRLYDSLGTVLANCGDCFFSDGGDNTTFLSASLTAGTYFLEVDEYASGPGNVTGTYNFDISTTTAPVPLPAGLPLLLAGFGALAVMRRRG